MEKTKYYIRIGFADGRLKMTDYKEDIRNAVKSASCNLFSRHKISLSNPIFGSLGDCTVVVSVPEDKEFKNPGARLRGVASYLLDKSEHSDIFKSHTIGDRLLSYHITDENEPDYLLDDAYDGPFKEILRRLDAIEKKMNRLLEDHRCTIG